jgi:TonB family protein
MRVKVLAFLLVAEIALLGASDPDGIAQTQQKISSTQTTAPAGQELDPGRYLASLQRRVKAAWAPPADINYTCTVIGFHIERSGGISNVHIVKSSGWRLVDESAWAAVQHAASLEPWPQTFVEPNIEFMFERTDDHRTDSCYQSKNNSIKISAIWKHVPREERKW